MLYMYGLATEKTDLVFYTSYKDVKHTQHIQARRHSSDGLPNDMCEISTVTKFS